jgi:hypothetical protein
MTGVEMSLCEVAGVRRRCVQAALGIGALLLPGVTAVQASAATLAVNQVCFVNKFTRTSVRQAPVLVTGSGYVPGDSVTITSSDGSVNKVVQATPAGTLDTTIGAPTPFLKLPSSKALTLTATDFINSSGTVTGTTFLKVTDLAVATVPALARPSRSVTWYFAGFTTGRYIYGHYTRNGREVARARFGRAKGDCGLLRVKARFFPGGHQRYRSYGLQFDDSGRYNKHSSPRIVTSLGSH